MASRLLTANAVDVPASRLLRGAEAPIYTIDTYSQQTCCFLCMKQVPCVACFCPLLPSSLQTAYKCHVQQSGHLLAWHLFWLLAPSTAIAAQFLLNMYQSELVLLQVLQSLSTYKLTPDQAADTALDLLTGVPFSATHHCIATKAPVTSDMNTALLMRHSC